MGLRQKLRWLFAAVERLETFVSVLGWFKSVSIAAASSTVVTVWGYFWYNIPPPILTALFVSFFTILLGGLLFIKNQVSNSLDRKKDGEEFPVELDSIIFSDAPITISEETTRYTISEIFDRLTTEGFPVQKSFGVFSKFRFPIDVRPDFEVRYCIKDKDEEIIFSSVWSDISISAGYSGTNYVRVLNNVTFQEPGNYYVSLELRRQKKIYTLGRSILIVVRKQLVVNEPPASDTEDSQTQ